MSIETLKSDLDDIVKSANELQQPQPDVFAWLTNHLLPWTQSLTEEVAEMDKAIQDLVDESVDVLHSDSAELFARIIAGGAKMAAELRTRVGDDRRVLKEVADYVALLGQGKSLLEEIYIADDEEEEEGEEEDDQSEEEQTSPGATPISEGGK